jgi:CRP-like cAMP-binding protein
LSNAGAGTLTSFMAGVFDCAPDVAESICRRCVEKGYPARAAIVRQGDAGGQTYLVTLGLAHALAHGFDGQRVLLLEFEPGDIFGAVTEKMRPPSQAEIVAVEETRAAVFPALDFLALIETYSCVGLTVTRALVRQLQATTARIVARTTLSSNGRVYAELKRLAEAAPDGQTISPPPVLSELAERVHTTRETASRAVGAAERRGVIRRSRDALVVVSPHRLEEMIV